MEIAKVTTVRIKKETVATIAMESITKTIYKMEMIMGMIA